MANTTTDLVADQGNVAGKTQVAGHVGVPRESGFILSEKDLSMFFVDAAALQFVTYVDERICNRDQSYLSIPYARRFRVVINIYTNFELTLHTIRRSTEGRMVHFVEFSGEIEDAEPTADGLPARVIPYLRSRVAAIKSFKKDVEEDYDSSERIIEFWDVWRPVNEAIMKGNLHIDGWDESGRMFLKGKHGDEEFKIPDFFLSGIGKHL